MTRVSRREILAGGLAVTAGLVGGRRVSAAARPTVTVYKSPT
jgi:hypothetical protein